MCKDLPGHIAQTHRNSTPLVDTLLHFHLVQLAFSQKSSIIYKVQSSFIKSGNSCSRNRAPPTRVPGRAWLRISRSLKQMVCRRDVSVNIRAWDPRPRLAGGASPSAAHYAVLTYGLLEKEAVLIFHRPPSLALLRLPREAKTGQNLHTREVSAEVISLCFDITACLRAYQGAIVVCRACTDKTTRVYHSAHSLGCSNCALHKTIIYSLQ